MNTTVFSFTLGDRLTPALGALCGVLLALAAIGCSPSTTEDAGGEAACTPVPGEVISRIGDPLPADATLRQVLEHPDAFERIQRVAQILQRSGPEDLEEIRFEFDNAALERGDYEYGLFGHWWARFDPQAAFIYSDTHLRTESPAVILQVVRSWAHKDPIGAVESGSLNSFANQIPAMRDELTDTFVVGWFEQMDANGGEEALLNWIVSQQDSGGIARGLKAFARMRVLRDGDQATLDWIRTEPYEPAVNRLLLAGALSVIAHQNPTLAADWIPIAAEDGVDVRTFIPRVARSWAHHEPRASLDWTLTQPDSSERNTAIASIARNWIRKDEAGMAAWLATVEPVAWTDALRNQSVRYHVRSNGYRVDWAKLMERAERIAEEKPRAGLHAWLLQRWFVVDEAAANAWIAAHPDAVPADMVERARKISPRDRKKITQSLAGRAGLDDVSEPRRGERRSDKSN